MRLLRHQIFADDSEEPLLHFDKESFFATGFRFFASR